MNQHGNLVPIDPTDCLTPGHLRTLRITAGAILMGVVCFLGIALWIVQLQRHGQGMAPHGDWPVVSFVAVAVLGICAPLSFIIPSLQTRSALRQILAGTWKIPAGVPPTTYATSGAKLMAVRQTTLTVGLALLNGPAYLGCIAYLLEAHPIALGVVAVAIVLMLWKFPSEGGVRIWLERQAEALNELQQLQDLAAER
jgi:hypothetical protein